MCCTLQSGRCVCGGTYHLDSRARRIAAKFSMATVTREVSVPCESKATRLGLAFPNARSVAGGKRLTGVADPTASPAGIDFGRKSKSSHSHVVLTFFSSFTQVGALLRANLSPPCPLSQEMWLIYGALSRHSRWMLESLLWRSW
jgi:hypothetical protein